MEGAELRGIVAMDGPSGTGKSTVSRRLAFGLRARYLDTGAMYRAVTLAVLRSGTDPADAPSVARVAAEARLSVGTDPERPEIRLDGEDVAAEIRGEPVTQAVSAVAAVPEVRGLLVAQQQAVIAEARGVDVGIVVEGRDIGEVVAPEAGLKVYLTADAEVRARRRSAQDSAQGRRVSIDETHADVRRRDEFDSSRAVSPLRRGTDAVEVDTTHLDVAGVLAELSRLVVESGLAVTRPRSPR
ncbi:MULTISPECIES: (d)CMP kinase [Actinoalloteichus]|uniref:Cytidylate kinase n=1 Tax=Actinoalloteichus fjordicus TaxID=1612552 RepID=A0AAC9PRR4_9PSEU|nr:MULTISPECIES: (d)CMP kinase [Actinoalloteichus]APU14076.1 cytidylate kinase [Actinoalloteichus fjordicus]APU20023.1 cytidylate kinase [Actinoalloteichus sp. GBA129-24]